jgi:hypothetical protein
MAVIVATMTTGVCTQCIVCDNTWFLQCVCGNGIYLNLVFGLQNSSSTDRL